MRPVYASLFILAIKTALSVPLISNAQATSDIQKGAPPQVIVSAVQPWLTRQEWFCIPKAIFDPNKFVDHMGKKINSIAQSGWELLAFNQVTLAENSCFLATFKAPRK